MNSLLKVNNGLSVLEESFYSMCKMNSYSNPSLTLHTSMVYGFAKHLPYSMDIEQPEYVPGDYLILEPFDVDQNSWFKWEDRRTIGNAMLRWGDTKKSSTVLHVCYIFQQMLLGNAPAVYDFKKDDYDRLGISSYSSDSKYNENLFNVLRMLPTYYDMVLNTSNNDERRHALEEMYCDICFNIENRVGGVRYSDKNSIIREHKATINWPAYRDVEMLVYNACYNYFDGLKLDITKQIKEMQLKSYTKRLKLKNTNN